MRTRTAGTHGLTGIGTGMWVLVVAALVQPALAEETPAPVEFNRPQYQILRQNEDWSGLGRLAGQDTGDPWDPIKFIPLNDDGSAWLSFGGQARLRGEYWENFGFTEKQDDVFLLTRVLLHADLHITPHFRFFAQAKSAMSIGRDLTGGHRTLDVDEIDLQQAFAEFWIPLRGDISLTIRPGRQMLLFGKQRLVSPLEWSNTLRAWDGISATIKHSDLVITPFWTEVVPVDKYGFNEPDAQQMFYGFYLTSKLCCLPVSLDAYWLALEKDDPVTINGTTGSEDRHTVGGRLWGPISDTRLDYDLEGAYQFGELGSAEIDAFMVEGELGCKLGTDPTAPRIYVVGGYASGDETPGTSPSGTSVQTFNQLFPLGHAYLGYIDEVGRQNIINVNPGITFNLGKPVMVRVDGHAFWLADDADVLYSAGGTPRPRDANPTGTSKQVGYEVDLLFNIQFDAHTVGTLGLSRFFRGNYLKDTTTTDDINFVYAILQYTF